MAESVMKLYMIEENFNDGYGWKPKVYTSWSEEGNKYLISFDRKKLSSKMGQLTKAANYYGDNVKYRIVSFTKDDK